MTPEERAGLLVAPWGPIILDMTRPRRRFVLWGFVFSGGCIALGLLLATHQRLETAGCSRGPCDPGLTLPYMWPGMIILSGGLVIGLALCALALAAWRRTAGGGRAAMGTAVAFFAVGAFGFAASLAVAVVASTSHAWTTVVPLVPLIGFFGVLAVIGLAWLWDRHRLAESI